MIQRQGCQFIGRSGLVACLLISIVAVTGCISPWKSSDSDKTEPSHDWDKIRVVGDLTVPGGLNNAKVQGVTMVTQLKNTGSDPAPSPARDFLLNEMRIRQVEQPQSWLLSPTTSLAALEAVIPPGARKGDMIDVRVNVPPESETTSLEHGFAPETRLSEAAFLGGRIRTGHEIALASGPILLDSVIEGKETPGNLRRGVILGGGILREERPLGLGLIESRASVAASSRVGAVINARFYMYRGGSKKGVATPKSDKFINLDVHPRYQGNISRYMRVIRYIPISTSPSVRAARLVELETELLEEATTQAGALKLEAMGKEAIDSLKKGLQSDSQLVRFCSAEALAYLDSHACLTPLTEAARDSNAFRYRAFQALASFDELEVIDHLESLLHAESAETRYGAFEALKKRSPNLPSIRGTLLENGVSLHLVQSTASPMVHVRLKNHAEIVIFGNDVRCSDKISYIGDNGLTIQGVGHRKLKITRFKSADEEVSTTSSTNMTELIQALAVVESDYGDTIKNLFALRNEGAFDFRLEVDAMPRSDRNYLRPEESGSFGGDETPSPTENFTTSEPEQSEQPAETPQTDEVSQPEIVPTDEGALIPTFD